MDVSAEVEVARTEGVAATPSQKRGPPPEELSETGRKVRNDHGTEHRSGREKWSQQAVGHVAQANSAGEPKCAPNPASLDALRNLMSIQLRSRPYSLLRLKSLSRNVSPLLTENDPSAKMIFSASSDNVDSLFNLHFR
jgi:hypothetical protein